MLVDKAECESLREGYSCIDMNSFYNNKTYRHSHIVPTIWGATAIQDKTKFKYGATPSKL